MTTSITRIKVTNLNGFKDIDARVKDNTLILVGENGSGKTTFLRIVFSLLSARWRSLSLFTFDSIVLSIDKTEIEIRQSDLKKAAERTNDKFLGHLPSAVRKNLVELVESGEARRNPEVLEHIAHNYGVPLSYIADQLHLFDEEDAMLSNTVQRKLQQIQTLLDAQVLYLPTYRRIERELASIVDWVDPDTLRRRRTRPSRLGKSQEYIELVEFGMQDVQNAVNSERESLQRFQSDSLRRLTLTHFGDIVSSAYKPEDVNRLANMTDSDIEAVLNRVDESIVDSTQRSEWLQAIQKARSITNPSARDQIICHYFLKILKFQESLQIKETQMSNFCRICSEYIRDKEFVYDSTTFSFSIKPKFGLTEQDNILLSDLSSGEKQVVSLFSHLYLSGQSKYFVLIDEPELSLSVPWQRRFLVDIKQGGFCVGLVAVTHSPFIYDNELRPYAHSLGEFLSL